MKPSLEKQKSPLRIAIIVAAILAMLALAFFVFIPRYRPATTTVPNKDAASAKTIVKEEPAISEDSIRREMEREREMYAKEQARFAKVLKEASDEELFVMLNYAIAQHYVPNYKVIDPYGYVFVGVTKLHRSYLVYEKLSGRKDLLRKIYSDVKVLDEYVHWGRQSGQPYPDANVSKTIMDNAKKECQGMDHRLVSKYFGTPLMRD